MTPSPEDSALILGPEWAGTRLDRALLALAPGASLALRRRLIETGQALLDGRVRPPGHKVRIGQTLALAPSSAAPGLPPSGAAPAASTPSPLPHSSGPLLPPAALLVRQGSFAALRKPAGLPTAALAGKPGPSLEALLPALLPGEAPILLTRLDTPTSGLVLAALAPEAAQTFRTLESRNLVRKQYLAVVHGRLDHPLVLTQALDTAKRKKTRVLSQPDPDPARHTRAEPLAEPPGLAALAHGPLTLIRAVIGRGARHQIRAHLAQAGHPLLGDPLYGPKEEAPRPLLLHHQQIDFPGFSARIEPDWPEVFGPGEEVPPQSPTQPKTHP
jgi:23S rRNA pseudouridine1911/1915/1917 synthase